VSVTQCWFGTSPAVAAVEFILGMLLARAVADPGVARIGSAALAWRRGYAARWHCRSCTGSTSPPSCRCARSSGLRRGRHACERTGWRPARRWLGEVSSASTLPGRVVILRPHPLRQPPFAPRLRCWWSRPLFGRRCSPAGCSTRSSARSCAAGPMPGAPGRAAVGQEAPRGSLPSGRHATLTDTRATRPGGCRPPGRVSHVVGFSADRFGTAFRSVRCLVEWKALVRVVASSNATSRRAWRRRPVTPAVPSSVSALT